MAELTRRRALMGWAAAGVIGTIGIPGLARAGQPGPTRFSLPDISPQDIPAPAPLDPIRLIPNLFTRVGTLVTINGRGPYTFVIDTGAGVTAITDIVAAELALPASRQMLVHGITSATVTDSVAIEQLSIAGLDFENLRAPVLPFGQVGAHGLIGLDILSRFKLGFDVEGRVATLDPGELRVIIGEHLDRSRGARRNNVRSARGAFGQLILTEAYVNGFPVAAFIDSGAQYSIANRALFDLVSARRPESLIGRRPVPIYGVTGQSLPGELAQVQELRLGRARLGPTSLLFADLHCFQTLELADRPALLVGADILSRFRRISIDFSANEVVLDGLRRRMDPLGVPDQVTGAG